MATGGGPESYQPVKLPVSDISLTVTGGDLVKSHAECVATGEDSSLLGAGMISQLLTENCPSAYRSAKTKLKRDNKHFKFGQIYACTFPNPGAAVGQGVSFNTVLHAIVPSFRQYSSEREWKDQMKLLYYNMFKAADTHGKSSLALPLLGSGGAGAGDDVATDVLVHALVTFRFDGNPKSHPLKNIEVFVRKSVLSSMITRLHEKLKVGSPSNGLTSQAYVRPVQSAYGTHQGNQTQSSLVLQDAAAAGSTRGNTVERKTFKSTRKAGKYSLASNGYGNDSNLQLILSGLSLQDSKSVDTDSEEEAMEWKDSDVECDETYESAEEACTAKEEPEEEAAEEDKCAICLDLMDTPKKLDKCGHTFCKECIEDSFKHHKPACPTCNTMYGLIIGNQPKGRMTMTRNSQSLPGYRQHRTIIIDYEFPSGVQGKDHPNPGHPYSGTQRRAFLPDCEEGRKVYRLLRVAFENQLTFTVGRSRTTGADNVVTWNDIHHKTHTDGGTTNFGYPDPHYLSRVQEELAAKGVTEECLRGRTFDL